MEAARDKEVCKVVRKLSVLQTKWKFSKIAELFDTIKNEYSLREIADKSGITLSHLQWIVKVGNDRRKQGRNCRAVTDQQCEFVQQFYLNQTMTMSIPYK